MRLGFRTKHKRCKRYDIPGYAHELTFTCFRRYKLLESDRARQWLVDAVSRARVGYAFDVWAYVIMPEHVHLLIFPRQGGYSISRILSAIKWPVAHRALTIVRESSLGWATRLTDRQPNGRVAMRFWQRGGGYDRNMVKTTTIHESVHYIHDNPVRRGLVDHPSQWRWSSAGWYDGRRDVPLDMDETLPVAILDGDRKHVRP